MARLPRFVLPGQPQHVIQRGNNRQKIFRADGDYRFYLDKLRGAAQKHGCTVHAYVLMTNHVHLLVTPQTENTICLAACAILNRIPSGHGWCRTPRTTPGRAIAVTDWGTAIRS